MTRRARASLGIGIAGLSFLAAQACGSFSGGAQPSSNEAGPAEAAAEDRPTPPPPDAPGPDADTGQKTGCSDGTREAFLQSPDIAGCEGAWGLPGISTSNVLGCNRLAGNTFSDFTECTVADLCALGWHVCRDANDVFAKGGGGPDEICTRKPVDGGLTFFATGQGSGGAASCLSGGSNDVFGCGDVPPPNPMTGCTPLNTFVGSSSHPPNFTFGGDISTERDTAMKQLGPGGVLCCKDD